MAAFRAQLVGSSSGPAKNEELRRLTFSALLDIDPSVAPNKQALFDRLLQEQPASVAALAELVQH
jgi:predicted transcriptional regulator